MAFVVILLDFLFKMKKLYAIIVSFRILVCSIYNYMEAYGRHILYNISRLVGLTKRSQRKWISGSILDLVLVVYAIALVKNMAIFRWKRKFHKKSSCKVLDLLADLKQVLKDPEYNLLSIVFALNRGFFALKIFIQQEIWCFDDA